MGGKWFVSHGGGGKVNKKKRIVHTIMVLHSFFEKRLYYEQIHLYMWIKIKLFVVL